MKTKPTKPKFNPLVSKELKFGEPFAFRLLPEDTEDGGRIERERAEQIQNQREQEKQQLRLTHPPQNP